MKILIIEDDKAFSESLKEFLGANGFAADLVPDGENGLIFLKNGSREYDAIILDWMLPGKSGLDVLKDLRAEGTETPVILLTAKNELRDKIAGFDTGADDYLTKPFEPEELLSRLRVLVRRPRNIIHDAHSFGGIKIDRGRKIVSAPDGREIKLTKKEFSILEFMILSKNRAVGRGEIQAVLWPDGKKSASNVIDVHIHSLRKKLKQYDSDIIEAVPGIGYRLR